MEPESSLPLSQVPATCPYPEPARSSPCPPHSTSWRSSLILSSHLRLGLPGGLFLSGFHTPKPCKILSPHTCYMQGQLLSFLTLEHRPKWGISNTKGRFTTRRKSQRYPLNMKLGGPLSRSRRFGENTVGRNLNLCADHFYVWNGHCGPSLTFKLLCSCVPFSQFTYHLHFFFHSDSQAMSGRWMWWTDREEYKGRDERERSKRRSGPVSSDEQNSANLFRNFTT